ncbi:hypothetical protein [Arthrobacter mobilis]|uniref:N-acetyl-1-D-myo-inositol-2-amino-2-deoxy-alpha-D-glucopyranoside deacetylase n=1 Tax=Arthrobacter mobilis TaxID=2724944 RepID=A0A7X6K528_9MICC|nr:hypothetical protein [Arthrobacter mobilis]NKX53739.1 hypothetical protein [Arthrobacter mobilis]
MSEQRQPAGYGAGGLPPAVNPAGRHRHRTRAGLGTAVVSGMVAAVLGTSLHGRVLYLDGAGYPWGAVAALVFAVALLVWAGVRARNVLMSGVAGMVAYVLVGLMVTGMGQEPLIITDTTAEPELTVAVAGRIWVVGLAAATVAAIAVCAWALKPGRALR